MVEGILGAIWRRVDGSKSKPEGWHLLPCAFIVYSFWAGDYHSASAYLIAYIALLDGFSNWKDWSYMAMRYTGYTALACCFLPLSNWYIACGVVSGIVYPLGASIKRKFTSFQYTVYAEIVAGGLMFGGVRYAMEGVF